MTMTEITLDFFDMVFKRECLFGDLLSGRTVPAFIHDLKG